MSDVETFIEDVERRLDAEGYDRRDDVPDGATDVFHHRGFSITKFGLIDTFVVFTALEEDDPDAAESFSQSAFEYGLDNKSALPRGLGGNLVVYPVVMGDSLVEVRDWVASYQPKHWSSFEFPVAVDLDSETAAFNESKPNWGRAYYSGFQKFADRTMTP